MTWSFIIKEKEVPTIAWGGLEEGSLDSLGRGVAWRSMRLGRMQGEPRAVTPVGSVLPGIGSWRRDLEL